MTFPTSFMGEKFLNRKKVGVGRLAGVVKGERREKVCWKRSFGNEEEEGPLARKKEDSASRGHGGHGTGEKVTLYGGKKRPGGKKKPGEKVSPAI